MTEQPFGARIERGIVIEYQDGMCMIASLDRPGLVTPMFRCETQLSVGDEVAFAMWDDGRGGVFWKMSDNV